MIMAPGFYVKIPRLNLDRTLRLPNATALVVGTILGSAVFVQASEVTEHVPQIWVVLLVWCAAGLLSLFGALACAELASAFPRTGGVYVFLACKVIAVVAVVVIGFTVGSSLPSHFERGAMEHE